VYKNERNFADQNGKCRKYIALHVFLQDWQVAQLSKMAEKCD
jgi:hypothetical protein